MAWNNFARFLSKILQTHCFPMTNRSKIKHLSWLPIGLRDCVIDLFFCVNAWKRKKNLRECGKWLPCVMREKHEISAWIRENQIFPAWFCEMTHFQPKFCNIAWKPKFSSHLIISLRECVKEKICVLLSDKSITTRGSELDPVSRQRIPHYSFHFMTYMTYSNVHEDVINKVFYIKVLFRKLSLKTKPETFKLGHLFSN